MAHGGGELWSVGEAGSYLGVSRATVYRLAARGDLVLVHIRRRVWVHRASVLAFRDRAVSAATPPHGLPLGGTWGGATWVGGAPPEGPEGQEGTG